eukprot:TRINITY_DN12358_c1_g1_i3.p1 TRINITY_DN12358_c1_g1~~TRINITY_DN12358_c1_g1_i3.p1  ORF type:complete len:155 (-),score=9.47 TRINITY_DN12358_c1_g1_i3:1205-1669(-)
MIPHAMRMLVPPLSHFWQAFRGPVIVGLIASAREGWHGPLFLITILPARKKERIKKKKAAVPPMIAQIFVRKCRRDTFPSVKITCKCKVRVQYSMHTPINDIITSLKITHCFLKDMIYNQNIYIYISAKRKGKKKETMKKKKRNKQMQPVKLRT